MINSRLPVLRTATAVGCALLFAVAATAQDTRVAVIADEQGKKAKSLDSEGPSKAEQIVVRIISSPLMAARVGPYPWFGSVFGGAGFSMGAGYFNKLPWGGAFNAVTGMSVNYSKMAEVNLELPELARGLVRFDAYARHMDVKDVKFYGNGTQSRFPARVHYDYQPDEMGLNGSFRPVKWFAVSGGLARLGVDTRFRGEPPPDEPTGPVRLRAAPGIGESLTFNIARVGATIDWRDAPGYSTRGGFYRLAYERDHESNDKPFSFHATELEVVQLVPLVKEQYVIAVRGLVTYSASDRQATTPVILAPYLGSGSTLRGFPSRRFTDRNRVLLTGEYRWRPSRYLDMALFMDAGQVFATRRQFDVGSFEHAWGAGVRIHGPTFTAIRVDAAKSREGWRFVFATGQPF